MRHRTNIGVTTVLAVAFYLQQQLKTCFCSDNIASTVYGLESEGQLCSPISKDFGEIPSRIECVIKCDLQPGCIGVFHSNASRSCFGVDVNLSITTESCSSEGVSSTFMLYRNSASQSAGHQSTATVDRICQTDDDCIRAFPNTDCRQDGVCTCVAGFSLVPATNTCVTSCPGDYGDSFTPTAGFRLVTIDVHTDAYDGDHCCELCKQQSWCASASYLYRDNGVSVFRSCYRSSKTKHGYEHSWKNGSDNVYYQRNCA